MIASIQIRLEVEYLSSLIILGSCLELRPYSKLLLTDRVASTVTVFMNGVRSSDIRLIELEQPSCMADGLTVSFHIPDRGSGRDKWKIDGCDVDARLWDVIESSRELIEVPRRARKSCYD